MILGPATLPWVGAWAWRSRGHCSPGGGCSYGPQPGHHEWQSGLLRLNFVHARVCGVAITAAGAVRRDRIFPCLLDLTLT